MPTCRRSSADTTSACSVLPVAMMIADGIEASMLRLASALPIHTPGHRRGPRTRSAASAIPEGGHSAVAYPGGIASSRANLAAPK